MNRDPFFQAIETGLAGQLDPDVFESCAADLLRDEWPSLVPVRGGGDEGQDGAVGDLEGGAFPLIITISSDVIGNLSRNLETFAAKGHLGRRVIVATSQALTAQRRNNLERRAVQKGFQLAQIYDRSAFADRLYHSPSWCRGLLGITSRSSAVAAVPLTSRPLLKTKLIGRDGSIEWLRATTGDRVLTGEPGSGKTHLLYMLAQEDWCGFMVTAERDALADAIREQQPQVIVVDDAHVRPDWLEQLTQLRRETGAEFNIVVTVWPGHEERFVHQLGIAAEGVHRLGRLTRKQIVEVIHETGVGGPDELIRSMVDQAVGRPGLAVTLASLCLMGNIRDVTLGDALARSVRSTLRSVVGDDGAKLLAAFAAGGRDGMPVDGVSEFLGISRLEAARQVADLAYGGVVTEKLVGPAQESWMIVEPEVLRYALVRDDFFQGPVRLPYWQLIDRAPSRAEAVSVLVGAAGRGADVSRDLLRAEIASVNSGDVWEHYTWIGSAEAEWVLATRPDLIERVSDAALVRAPDAALSLLLNRAVGRGNDVNHQTDHPLRKVRDWIEEAYPGSGQGVERRRILLTATVRWLDGGGDTRVGTEAIAIAVSPQFHLGSTDPGAGDTFRWSRGPLTLSELDDVAKLWGEAVALAKAGLEVDLPRLVTAVEDWAYPYRAMLGEPNPDVSAKMQGCAAKVLSDLLSIGLPNDALLLKAAPVAEHLKVDLGGEPSEQFALLFGHPRFSSTEDWQARRLKEDEAFRKLASRLAVQAPSAVIDALEEQQVLAREAGLGHGRLLQLANHLSAVVEDPVTWLNTLMERRADAEFTARFVARCAELGGPGALAALRKAIESTRFKHVASSVVVRTGATDADITELAFRTLSEDARHAGYACSLGGVDADILSRLFTSTRSDVAGLAAAGAWQADPTLAQGPLAQEWRRAMVRCPLLTFAVREALSSHPGLAHDWLRRHLPIENAVTWFSSEEEPDTLIDPLDSQARSCILSVLTDENVPLRFVVRLVGDDINLYRELLAQPRLIRHHLQPIHTLPDEAWCERVKAALQHGYSVDEIAAVAADWPSEGWTGPRSMMFEGRRMRFKAYEESDDPGVGSVVRRTVEQLEAKIISAKREEHVEAIHGR